MSTILYDHCVGPLRGREGGGEVPPEFIGMG